MALFDFLKKKELQEIQRLKSLLSERENEIRLLNEDSTEKTNKITLLNDRLSKLEKYQGRYSGARSASNSSLKRSKRCSLTYKK